jgi:hypothetical protein
MVLIVIYARNGDFCSADQGRKSKNKKLKNKNIEKYLSGKALR